MLYQIHDEPKNVSQPFKCVVAKMHQLYQWHDRAGFCGEDKVYWTNRLGCIHSNFYFVIVFGVELFSLR